MAELKKSIKITVEGIPEAEGRLAKLEVRFKEFGESMEAFGNRFQGISNATSEIGEKFEKLGIASVFAEGGLFGLANKVADVGYELGEAAIKTGLSTQQLQYWQFAAKQSGVDSETLTMALTRLTLNLGMANKRTSEQAQALRYLHVSTRDANGQLKDTNTMFKEVMKSLGGVTNGQYRNLASLALFSKSYQELLPLMKSISSGSTENADDFKKYGYVLSENAIKQSDLFHRSSLNLQTSLESLGMAVGEKLIPVLTPMIKSMSDYVSQNRKALSTNISNMILDTSKAFRSAWSTMLPFLKIGKDIVDMMGGMKTVIILLASYYVASLGVSFVQLGIQITIAAIAMGRFTGGLVVSGFASLISLVGKLRTAFVALNLVTMLNPVVIAVAGIAAAIGLIIFALKKLHDTWESIKASFNSHTGIYSKEFWKPGNSDTSGLKRGASTQLPGSFNALPQLLSMPSVANSQSKKAAVVQQQKPQTLNVNLKVDKDGNPVSATANSDSLINFSHNLGYLR